MSDQPLQKPLSLTQRLHAAIEAFFGYSPVKRWAKRHPTAYRRLEARLTIKRFTGLPLTLLSLAFLITLVGLLGVIQDYLSGDPLIAVDIRIANLLYVFRTTSGLAFFYCVTLLAMAGTIIVASVILTVILWWKKHRLLAFSIWLSLIPSEAVTFFGKLLFHRGRPVFQAVTEDSFSFPSGHATTVVAFYGFLAYLLWRKVGSWKAKIGIVLSTIILTILVDLSRLYLGVHYLSDVLAGNLVGLLGVIFAITVIEWISTGKQPVDWKRFSPWLLMPSIGCIILVVGVLFWKAPALRTGYTRPPVRALLTNDVLSIFTVGGLPKYTETLLGDTQEPINIILVSKEDCLVPAFAKAGWVLADQASWTTVKRLSAAALLNKEYLTAPMTPSFFNAVPHDYGFEKETDTHTVRARHHARFWDTGFVSTTGEVYVGTVSLDTGIKWGITHRIAPDIDTERELLVSDLATSGTAFQKNIIPFVPPILGSNFSGDPFFTDGKVEVVQLQCR